MGKVLLVFVGGGIGSVARYGVALLLARAAAGGWPWGTLAVNCVGAFLIEVVFMFTLRAAGAADGVRLLLATGFLGGFTTYSTFNHELLSLARGGHPATAAGYLLATVTGGLVFGLAGLSLGRALFPTAAGS